MNEHEHTYITNQRVAKKLFELRFLASSGRFNNPPFWPLKSILIYSWYSCVEYLSAKKTDCWGERKEKI